MSEEGDKKKASDVKSSSSNVKKTTGKKTSPAVAVKASSSSAKKASSGDKKKSASAKPSQAAKVKKASAAVKKKSAAAASKPPAKKKSVYERVEVPEVGHRGRKTVPVNYIYASLLILLALLLLIVSVRAALSGDKAEMDTEIALNDVSWPFVFTVEKGMSATDVAFLLSPVLDEEEFLSYMESEGLSSSIRTGSYMLEASLPVREVASMLTSSPEVTLRVYPGKTIADIDSTLSSRGLASSGEFLKAADEICKGEWLSFSEGWFLSGDYEYVSPYDLALSMHKAMLELLRREADGIASADLSLSEIVIIASMINAETQNPEQMSEISAVIHNRLSRGMPLGIDATTRYELNDWSSPLSREVFESESPYNTRRKAGLPPSGISIPGESAVLASIYPSDNTDLYYLHGPDGTLYTSKTYEEHLKTYNRLY